MFEQQFTARDDIYLLNHSVGRPPIDAREQLAKRFFEPWESGDADVWPIWLQQIEQFQQALARLFNAGATDFCPQTNVSSAVTKIVHSLPQHAARKVIVCTEQDFPSIGFVLAQAERTGYTLRMIPAALDTQDPNVWAEHLSEDVACVLITHVYSNTGQQLPVGNIAKLAREREIVSIVDVCQSVGVVPIDVADWQADFVVGSCVKWLCGGPGAAWLWADPAILDRCAPIDVGWFSHESPFEFDIRNFRYAPNALKFWGGTPSIMPFAMAAGSIDLICDISIDRIRQHNIELSNTILDHLPSHSIVSPLEPEQRGGTLILDFGEAQADIENRLQQARVRFDARESGIRLSPHIYNTAEQMQIVLSCLV